MRDSELKKATDYSEGQREAAHRVLIEIANLLSAYAEDIRIIGGWVPGLLFPYGDHIGSIDVDVLLNHEKIFIDSYENIERMLIRTGYKQHPEKYFSFIKPVEVEGVLYEVDVDFLAGKYGGTSIKKNSQHLQGIKALKATGGNFAFEFPAEDIKIEAKRPDGAMDVGHVKVVSVLPFLVMKTAALNRQKPKDAYDIYYCIDKYDGGIRKLAEQFKPYKDREIIKIMLTTLSEKFASEEHSGPVDIVSFLGITETDEVERIKRDAFEKIAYLVTQLSK